MAFFFDGKLQQLWTETFHAQQYRAHRSRGTDLRNPGDRRYCRQTQGPRHQDQHGEYRRPRGQGGKNSRLDEEDRRRPGDEGLFLRLLPDPGGPGDPPVPGRPGQPPRQDPDHRRRYPLFQRTGRRDSEGLRFSAPGSPGDRPLADLLHPLLGGGGPRRPAACLLSPRSGQQLVPGPRRPAPVDQVQPGDFRHPDHQPRQSRPAPSIPSGFSRR